VELQGVLKFRIGWATSFSFSNRTRFFPFCWPLIPLISTLERFPSDSFQDSSPPYRKPQCAPRPNFSLKSPLSARHHFSHLELHNVVVLSSGLPPIFLLGLEGLVRASPLLIRPLRKNGNVSFFRLPSKQPVCKFCDDLLMIPYTLFSFFLHLVPSPFTTRVQMFPRSPLFFFLNAPPRLTWVLLSLPRFPFPFNITLTYFLSVHSFLRPVPMVPSYCPGACPALSAVFHH